MASKSDRSCVVPGCSNRRDRCKWGLFPSVEKKAGRFVYEQRRLCGTKNCKGSSQVCQTVTLPGILKDSKRCGALRKLWLQKIPRQNTPTSSHSCVCSVHFVGGTCDSKKDVPTIFLGQPVVSGRKTRVSSGREDLSQPVVDQLEGSAITPEYLTNVLGDHFYTKQSPDYLQQLMDDQRAKIALLQASVASLEEELVGCLPVACVKSLLCLNSTLVIVWKRLTTSNSFRERLHSVWTRRGERPARMLGKKNQYTQRRLSPDDKLLPTLVKLRHNFPESDLAVRFAVTQSTVSRTFSMWVMCLHHSFKEINIWDQGYWWMSTCQ